MLESLGAVAVALSSVCAPFAAPSPPEQLHKRDTAVTSPLLLQSSKYFRCNWTSSAFRLRGCTCGRKTHSTYFIDFHHSTFETLQKQVTPTFSECFCLAK